MTRDLEMAAGLYWRVARWSAETTVRAGTRIVKGALRGESPARLLEGTQEELRESARRLLGMVDPEARASAAVSESNGTVAATRDELDLATRGAPPATNGSAPEARAALRALGEELLRRSAEVDFDEDLHPAYARILGDLAADEARILRLLWYEGPQPAVDVRSAIAFGAGSQLVASGLSMIGMRSGCRHMERVPAYLNNLNRLGLVWFSREPVAETHRYQVLEVQPDVMDAKRSAGRGRTKRRSIHLTPFGKDFCDNCLPPPRPTNGSLDEG